MKDSGTELTVTITGRFIFLKENMETVFGYTEATGRIANGKKVFVTEAIFTKDTSSNL